MLFYAPYSAGRTLLFYSVGIHGPILHIYYIMFYLPFSDDSLQEQASLARAQDTGDNRRTNILQRLGKPGGNQPQGVAGRLGKIGGNQNQGVAARLGNQKPGIAGRLGQAGGIQQGGMTGRLGVRRQMPSAGGDNQGQDVSSLEGMMCCEQR